MIRHSPGLHAKRTPCSRADRAVGARRRRRRRTGDLPLQAPSARPRGPAVKPDVAAIREAEFDYHLEKLSAEDYRELRRHLEGQGLEVIRALEGPAAGTRRRADPRVSPS